MIEGSVRASRPDEPADALPKTPASKPLTSSGRPRAWVGVVANPGAGMGRARVLVARLARELRRIGIRPRIAWTEQARSTLVSDSLGDCLCSGWAVVGGDGTVSALVNERPNAPLTALPAGTENLFARSFALTSDPERAAASIARGRTADVDLGLVGDRRFILMAGFGFDAEVVTRHHQARVRRSRLPGFSSRASYVRPILLASCLYTFPEISVRVTEPGREELLTGATVFFFNLPLYALGLRFAPPSPPDDGRLDLLLFRKPGPLNALRYLWLIARGIHLGDAGVKHRRVSRALVSAAGRVPVQLDGDPAGVIQPGVDADWEVQALPREVRVLLPDAGG